MDSIALDGGRSAAEFRHPNDRYLVLNRLPPTVSDREATLLGLPHGGANSSLAPPPHRHLSQDETFHILSGTARFTLGIRGRGLTEKLASAGEVVVIPRRTAHTFCNASEQDELVLEFVLDPSSRGKDEAYFREYCAVFCLLFCPFASSLGTLERQCGAGLG